MKIIDKILRGRPLKSTLIDKINEIVDYLRATRIVGGHGITAKETAAGLVISVNGGSRAKDEEDDYAFVTAGPGVCISGTSETPAVSGSTNSSVPVSGATFSLLLEPGTDNVSITDGENGSKIISVTGSTSGDADDIPPYSALSFGGGAPEYGLGHTFLIKVKKGNVGFWDEGGGAVGKWANKAGTSSYSLTNKTTYNAPEDGWMRVSVVDDGSAPGECLSFFSPTGGFPLYKYGTFGSSGEEFPDYIALSTVPSGLQSPNSGNGIGITFLERVHANVPIKYEAPSGLDCLVLFAESVEGTTASMGGTAHLLSGGTVYTPTADGHIRFSILDDGMHAGGCVRLFVGTDDWSKALPVYRCGSFGNNGATGIDSSISGSTVTISLSGGTGSVKLKPGSNISITGSDGLYTIAATGSTSSGGGDSSLNFVTSVGIVVLTGSSKHLVYCPQATDSGGYRYNQYGFTLPGTATIDALNAATGKSLVNTGQFDDEGNIIFVLPENPTALTSVDIRLTSDSTDTIVCTVDGKKIVDASGGQQGVTNGVCDDGMDGGNHYMYVYITSISGFPEYYDAYGNETYIAQYIESDGGCWVRLDIDN